MLNFTKIGTFALLLAVAVPALAAPRFSLKDQYDRSHSSSKVFAGQPIVIIAGAQRKTQDAMEAWHKALRGKVPKGARMMGLADLDGVPFFIPHGAITKGMKEKFKKMPVLCDWDGEVYPKLGFPKGAVIAVAVFDGSGKRLGLIKGARNKDRVAKVLSLLKQAIGTPATAAN